MLLVGGTYRAYPLFERSRPPNVCGRFGRATASTEKNRDDSFELRMETTTLHAQFEEIITVILRKSCGSAKPSQREKLRARALHDENVSCPLFDKFGIDPVGPGRAAPWWSVRMGKAWKADRKGSRAARSSAASKPYAGPKIRAARRRRALWINFARENHAFPTRCAECAAHAPARTLRRCAPIIY